MAEIRTHAGRLLLTILGVGLFVGGPLGLALVLTRRDRALSRDLAYNARLSAKLERLKRECAQLDALQAALRDDPVSVERGMRETFGLVRKGEQTYRPIRVRFQRPAPAPKPNGSGPKNALQLLGALNPGADYGRFLLLAIIFGIMGLVFASMAATPSGQHRAERRA